ncbi:hypothetical protein C834K_0595 [Chlamydia poikilotherma]|uniref:Lipoprotein n=1 Tax=Chlamydia poikilotherma TaxID=1967783 RepID=A0A3B0PMQ7_9CHLA|nr:hypothetical protein [Chlamydia poikilotherma]SYX09049.1 hypothetical protein C834K_0595 [Chlamydia poikilotherma]
MRTQNFFLSKIRLLGALCLASLSVLITGCTAEDIFTTDKHLIEEAKSLAPIFTETKDTDHVWDTIKKAWGLSERLNYVPIVIYDDLMNPVRFQTKGKSLWNIPVNVSNSKRIFNYDARTDKKDNSAKNYADINALDLGNSKQASYFSAILHGIEKETFVNLCKHYPQHSLVPVIVTRSFGPDTTYTLGFMFSVTNPALQTRQDVLPNQERFLEIWNSISSDDVTYFYGENFPADYINTTVLANGEPINSLIPASKYLK